LILCTELGCGFENVGIQFGDNLLDLDTGLVDDLVMSLFGAIIALGLLIWLLVALTGALGVFLGIIVFFLLV